MCDHKRQRNSSSDIECLPINKQPKMSTPEKGISVISNEQLMQELLDMKKSMNQIVQDNAISHSSLRNAVDHLRSEISNDLQQKFDQLNSRINVEIGHMVARLDDMDTKLNKFEKKLKTFYRNPFDPDVTICVFGLKYDEPVDTLAEKLLKDIGLENVPIVNVLRVGNRDGKPGILKVELSDQQDKIKVLRSKSKLQNSRSFNRVYIRSSHSHVERVVERNFKTILSELPFGDQYRFTGHGILVKSQNKDKSKVVQYSNNDNEQANRLNAQPNNNGITGINSYQNRAVTTYRMLSLQYKCQQKYQTLFLNHNCLNNK